MKKNSEFTIVYVFGPEQCGDKYLNNDVLTREAMEWVKIGDDGLVAYHAKYNTGAKKR